MSSVVGLTQHDWVEFKDLITKANKYNLEVMWATVMKEKDYRKKRDQKLK